MKYNIFIPQEKILKIAPKIKWSECFILDYLSQWQLVSNQKVKKIIVDGEEFIWVNYNQVLNDLPLLRFRSKGTITKHIQSLKKQGLLRLFRSPDRTIYYRLSDLAVSLYIYPLNEGGVSVREQGVSVREQHNTTTSNTTTITTGNVCTKKGISAGKLITKTIGSHSQKRVVNKKKASRGKRASSTYPKKWYNDCIATYQRLKGIKLQGDEYKPVQQALKTMFMSGRKPDDIIRCMEFLAADKFYRAVWTINTVKLKLPEFLAGALDPERYLSQEELKELYYQSFEGR